VSRAIVAARALGLGRCHHATLYRFLSRGRWEADDVGRVLFRLLLPLLPAEIDAAVDDTLCHRSGPQIFGAGMHHDGARGSYGGQGGSRVDFAFGHSWVVLSLWVPLPWTHRGIAIPVLFRLYRSKKICPPSLYRKRTELAGEMLRLLCDWLPEGRRLNVSGDQEYGCRTLLRELPGRIEFAGAMPLNVALYEPKPKRWSGRGRRPIWGRRLPTPAQMFRETDARWAEKKVWMYGKEVTLLIRTFEATWPKVRGGMPVRVVLTRDPRGRYADRAFFCTNVIRTPVEVLQRVVRRWPLETTFQAAKGIIGIEEPRNGWWRRPHGERRPRKKAGPEPNGERGQLAVEHTVPLLFAAYGIVLVWYLARGKPQQDVAFVRQRQPWYTLKAEPSYGDMIAALRREIWGHRVSRTPGFKARVAETRRLAALLDSAA